MKSLAVLPVQLHPPDPHPRLHGSAVGGFLSLDLHCFSPRPNLGLHVNDQPHSPQLLLRWCPFLWIWDLNRHVLSLLKKHKASNTVRNLPINSMKWLSFLFKIFITFISFASSPTKSSSFWKRKNIPTTKVQTTPRDPQPPHRKDLCASESAQIALPAWICVGALSLHLYGNKSSTTFHEIRFSFPVRYCTPKSHFREPVSWISIPTISVTDSGHPISLLSTRIPTSCCSQCWKIAPTAKFIVL